MITEVDILGFKRFHKQNFAFSPLTILAGMNGSGKTSLIHAFLLMSEAAVGRSGGTVRLNGPFGMELGTAEDVRNWKSDDLIEFRLKISTGNVSTWRFGLSSEEALYLTLEEQPTVLPAVFSGTPRAFSYLCAERLGPRSAFSASPLPADALEVGVRGEHCAQILVALGDKPLADLSRIHPTEVSGTPAFLKYEVEWWLGQLCRPIEIDAVQYPGSAIFALRFRTPGGDWARAPNMGFGVSYALPIVLAGLTALPGGLLIVENPEAHLHPAGQSRMGSFLGWLAGKGVQVLVETHSDHVLNGIRRAIAEHKYLPHQDAIVHFFEASNDDEPVVHSLEFSAVGSVSHWPRGFFDQYQVDIGLLGRIRRGA